MLVNFKLVIYFLIDMLNREANACFRNGGTVPLRVRLVDTSHFKTVISQPLFILHKDVPVCHAENETVSAVSFVIAMTTIYTEATVKNY